MTPKQTQACRKLFRIRHNHPAVTITTQILAREEAHAAQISKATGPLALVSGSDGLGIVFDYFQAMLARKRQDWIHVRRLPVEMHWHDSSRARSNSLC